jgi:aspartyl-tRNA(Asn)/glutamyl-tRNA(Gln) amidotransferase subunit A
MTINELHQDFIKNNKNIKDVVSGFISNSLAKDKTINSCLRFTQDKSYVDVSKCEAIIDSYKSQFPDNFYSHILEDYPLFGVPYNLKDNILVEGEVSTCASKIIENFKAPYSATVYKRINEAGGILISQSNLDEWAVGSSTENSAYGASHNPFDIKRVPGGSSGGPAANVGSGQSIFSLGSDTGGSIRQPAAFCNVVGIKPTYGLVSRYGVMPLASSLDQVGPITNTVIDNIKVLTVIMGEDQKDQTSTINSVKDQLLELIKNPTEKIYTIGVPKEYFVEGIDTQIETKVKSVIDILKSKGHKIVQVNLPLTKYGMAVYYTTMTVETASNLQRYDGVRYGSQIPLNPQFEQFFSVRDMHFGVEPKRRIMLGTFASSSGYYDAYYNKACMVKTLMDKDFEKVFQSCDLLIAPTTPEFPFLFGDKTNDPVKMYLSDVLVYAANLCKIPSISVPLGMFDVEGTQLPTGIQIMADQYQEADLYNLSLQIEKIVKNN